MVGRKYTTFYLPLLKLACILLKTDTGEGLPPSIFFYEKFIFFFFFFCYFLSLIYTVVSDLDLDFERALKTLELLYFHPRTQALRKLSETTDDMKLDFSSDTNSSSESIYSPSEENSDNLMFYLWQIIENKITKSIVDVTFKDAAEMFKDDIKH